ncbi:MAG TPA: DUF4037 domain-containing protein [Ktedonobacteraceae bacterium]|nr:DUF4037 domain-containing protein [Ktedonobacteraceae bacterium]
MPSFVPGIELSRRFYVEVVRPLLAEAFPNLAYAAALLGPGSEVLGFDTEMSMDHDWGARLFIFLKEDDDRLAVPISLVLSQHLPPTFADFPVNLPDIPDEPRTRFMKQSPDGLVNHRVIPLTLRNFLRVQLGYDLAQALCAADWLTIPSHALGEITAGAVYHDDVGELTALRITLAWYPYDVWLYLLASGWQRIGQEEHLMPRAGMVLDELGSAIIGSRLVRDVMRLCFLMEKRYAPYAKWFGTAFQRLHCAQELSPLLWKAQVASTWQERESALSPAYEALARMHNALSIGPQLPESVSHFYTRPFQVIHGERFARAIAQQISDPEVKRIAGRHLIGNVDQWSDNTDIEGLERAKIRQLYE